MVTPRPPDIREIATRGCVALGVVGVSQFVAGASLCFVLVTGYVMQSRLEEVLAEKEARLTTIPVPARTLGAGTVITESDLEMVKVEAAYVPSKAVRRMEDLVGRTVDQRLLEGEYVRGERLAELTPNQGLNSIVPEGARAVAVDLRDGDWVVGFVEPGNAVDLLVTLPKDEDGVAETVTVVQAVRVLAVNEKVAKTADGHVIRTPQITLAIPLAFAEGVVHSLAIGNGKITLRSEIDLHRQQTNGARSFEKLGAGRVSVAEFRSRYSEADVTRWIEMVYGDRKVREPVVDPSLLRGIGPPPTVQVVGPSTGTPPK
jgi:pilus assembly protein CpaB